MLLSADVASSETWGAFTGAGTSGPVTAAAEVSAVPTAVGSTGALASLQDSGVRFLEAGGARLRRSVAKGEDGLTVLSRPAMVLHDQDGNVFSSFSAPAGFDPAGAGSTELGPDKQDELNRELTPGGLALLPHVPWSASFSFKGAMASDLDWLTFAVPVGPNTNALRLAVRPEIDDGSGMLARVDQMYLIDSQGNLVAEITGIASATTQTNQTLIVTLQAAPVGGMVVVRLIPALSGGSPSLGTAPGVPQSGNALGTLPPSQPTSSNGFMVEIQRSDGSAATPSAAPTSPLLALPPGTGAYPNTTPAPDFGGLGSSGATLGSTVGAAAGNVGYAVNMTNRTSYTGGRSAQAMRDRIEIEPEAESISLGPLVSRGAAPIGPVLATVIDDPAPSINRDEQARVGPDAARREGPMDDLDWRLRLGEPGGRSDGGLASRTGDDRSPMTTLMGAGGLPSLVASFPGGTGAAQTEELAATLQPLDGATVADQDLLGRASAQDDSSDDVARAGIATRAVGFVVALGLASGPLYPDLIAFARRRLARKRSTGPLLGRRVRRRLA